MQANGQILRVIIVSFLIAIFLGPVVIPVLKRLKVGQSIREEGPKSHFTKAGTPTMGGIIIILAVIISLFTSGYYTQEIWAGLFFTIGFGFIGFLDDYIKVVLKRNLGLRAYQKIIGQLIFAFLLALYGSRHSAEGTKLIIPFINTYIDLGVLYIPFVLFVVLGTVNAVNLTDGLDGLNTGVTLIVMAAFSLIANSMKDESIIYEGISIFSAGISGACLGFLKHNANPAKAFMGDTGSLALGGAVSVVAVLSNMVLLIPIIGGIYFAEALSVIIQVLYYKRTKKRVFKMAPLHHHFEMCGWKETKVVAVFWIATVILAFIGIYSV
ncbi:phospho-N-acetylmuramoyl-pentapeptide-transferase [Sedimentibacter hydroxybenzoicus DSM 7310]|uniref:Phospho-N-acetylmuramoyl-pentapeptide-transferase n=1 Tax=Sedimentibacter hydroxybenzoicus DSM 7310 TaxID=1123245 RepID=A0A974BIQ0_SEDHY|nr:phospho-N-acetylmuramoyl-pentapeptide-transferase [Sedimentibacter hydroxybenzoicus]NYB73924.1 phospho-N-acetylmuramoyl-pentapeptide-transferase [Sedimentibacter hydroxybenzoicus DSM 7310]